MLRFALLALLLAGCLGAEPVAPAASLDPESVAGLTEVPLEPFEGEFLLAANAPPNGACPGAGSVFTPAPSEGTWVEWTLPEGTSEVALVLDAAQDPLGDIGYRLCAFDGEARVFEGSVAVGDPFDVEVSGATLRLLVAPEGPLTTPVNLGVRSTWTLSATALVSAPAAPA